MRIITVFLAALTLAGPAPAAAQSPPGELTGGVVYSLPSWFKSSFLDLQKDLEEARSHGRHVMVFMHLDECPYCARMLEENFVDGDTKEFVEARFDVIPMNVRGSLEVTWMDGNTYVESELADRLGAVATPTIVFLDLDGNKVLQLNGYRDPPALRHALDYVYGKHYQDGPFADYLATKSRPVVYEFRDHPQLTPSTYLKGYHAPLAVLFEDRYCAECDRFHERTLNHPNVTEALKPFLFVRLDADSDQTLVAPDGRVTTPAKWVKALGLTYRPAVVLFNEGREMFRADGRLYHHHLTEALRYVSEGYRQYDTLDDFRPVYREELMKNGIDVDFAE